jgi:hypothetical protein
LADYRAQAGGRKFVTDVTRLGGIMKSTPKMIVAALALSGGTLCFAQDAPGAGAPPATPHGATHDCTGMIGTALATCRQLNRNANEAAPTSAGTANDCSGMTGAPLFTCRRLNEAEAEAPRSGAGISDDCSGQIGDALRACRALNGESDEFPGAAGQPNPGPTPQ